MCPATDDESDATCPQGSYSLVEEIRHAHVFGELVAGEADWGLSVGGQEWPLGGASTVPDIVGSWEIVIYRTDTIWIYKSEVKKRIEFLIEGKPRRQKNLRAI